MYCLMIQTFSWLLYATVLNERVFCVSGGIGRDALLPLVLNPILRSSTNMFLSCTPVTMNDEDQRTKVCS